VRSPKGKVLLPQKNTNTSYDVQIVKIGPPVFAQLTLLLNPQNPRLYNAFQSVIHPLKVSLPVRTSTPHVILVPWTHLIQHPKLHIDRFSLFAQLTRDCLYALQCSLRRD